ncbi:MAG: histidine kinase [Flavobacteriaceae bacterium]
MTPHFIFNSLAVLQGMILNKEEGKSVSYLSKFSKLLRLTLENSRDKMVLLSKELEALENYIQLQTLESDQINFSITLAEGIDPSTLKIPPMLIQPFVENAVEHAFKNNPKNREISLNLSFQKADLTCTIMDNGVGIDAQAQTKNSTKTSLSTVINKERLQFLSKDFKKNGSITIEDRKKYDEKGTLVTLIIPYQKADTL